MKKDEEWVIRVQQLTAEIQANANDSHAKAEEKREILQAQARRYPLAEIARLVGISRERISMIVNRAGTGPTRPHHTVRLGDRVAVLEAHNAGEALADIAARFRVTPRAVAKHVKESTTA